MSASDPDFDAELEREREEAKRLAATESERARAVRKARFAATLTRSAFGWARGRRT